MWIASLPSFELSEIRSHFYEEGVMGTLEIEEWGVSVLTVKGSAQVQPYPQLLKVIS